MNNQTSISPQLDMSIEGMSSQSFSTGVFYFMMLGIVVFSAIVYMVMSQKAVKLKTGEKVMFGAIILGILAAIAFGAAQMLYDYLF